MAKKLRYTDSDFYGVSPRNVNGLTLDVRFGKRKGAKYAYVVYLDEKSIKWKIIPTVNQNGRVRGLRLFHRNSWGRKGFHSQFVWTWGTPSGLREIISYIENHEKIEASKNSWN